MAYRQGLLHNFLSSQSSQSSSSESKMIGHYCRAKTGYNWKDGDEESVGKIIRHDGISYVIRTKSGREYSIQISDIRELINVHAIQQYQVGDTIECIVDYHWKDGEYYDFCRILSVSIFCNDIDYQVEILKSKKTISVTQSSIKKRVELMKPKYSLNQYVGVKHSNGHPYYYDETIKNGKIIAINPWYDRISYTVCYEDGTTSSEEEYSITQPLIVKTPAQVAQEHSEYLKAEEQRLLYQLENVRRQMRH
jgi:hypothetical protein